MSAVAAVKEETKSEKGTLIYNTYADAKQNTVIVFEEVSADCLDFVPATDRLHRHRSMRTWPLLRLTRRVRPSTP